MAGNTVTVTIDQEGPSRHLIARQRTGLVGADDRGRTQSLDRLQSPNDRFLSGHVPHSHRKSDDENDR